MLKSTAARNENVGPDPLLAIGSRFSLPTH